MQYLHSGPGPYPRETFEDSATSNIFVHPKLCCAQKICFKHITKKNYLSPLKFICPPQTLKPGYWSGISEPFGQAMRYVYADDVALTVSSSIFKEA